METIRLIGLVVCACVLLVPFLFVGWLVGMREVGETGDEHWG